MPRCSSVACSTIWLARAKLRILARWTGPERRRAADRQRKREICHDYRNELYHVGLTHEGIIRAIAACYFDLCCDLFVRLPRGFRAWGSDDHCTEIGLKYIGSGGASFLPLGVDDVEIVAKLRAELPPGLPVLQPTLAESAQRAIDEVEEAFEFLAQDNPAGSGPDEILRVAQYQLELSRGLARDGIEGTWMTPRYSEAVAEVRAKLEVEWRQRHVSVPLDGWRARADALELEPVPLAALAAYQALRNDMAYLEEALGALASELDSWIQLEIDRWRGK